MGVGLGALLSGCGGPPCGLRSTVPGFEPDCDAARVAWFADETVVSVPGLDGGDLRVWLPADAGAGDYGGTTGNALSALVETADGSWLAETRAARLSLGAPVDGRVSVALVVTVDAGEVRGSVDLPAIGG
jgi:hypothetical protein